MFRIRTMDNISPRGLETFPAGRYEAAHDIPAPDAILLRSSSLHNIELPKTVLAVARLGAGVNNIPVDALTERGIAVFNTPGANANAVKELTLAALFLSSRDVAGAVLWGKSLNPADPGLSGLIEKEKRRFSGPEIRGKTLGVIGLGNIGVNVANDALALGMNVIGYDPFISVDAAWSLSRSVEKAETLESLLGLADYLTIHVPLTDLSRGMLNGEKFRVMKQGVRLINFARAELVDEAAVLAALNEGKAASFVTDFPSRALLAHPKVICTPHIGASTPEAEENCAVMGVEQLMSFLETGSVKNAVNFPSCKLDRSSGHRLVIVNRNVPNMVGQITSMLASSGINIEDMINHHRGNFAYNIIDVSSVIPAEIVARLQGIDGVVRARSIEG